MAISRRKARIAALIALYEWELGGSKHDDAIEAAIEEATLTPELAAYTGQVVRGTLTHRADIDERLSTLITEFDFMRVAAVDRNVMRIAAYELFHEPAIPPAVTINEAIEIAKRFSTAESGRFVNGVLGRLLQDSPKALWDPSMAPAEFTEERGEPEPEPEVEETTVEADSEEAKKLSRVGAWKIRDKS